MEPRDFAEVPDGPQALTLNNLWLQEKGAQIRLSEGGQSLAFTKNVTRTNTLHPSSG